MTPRDVRLSRRVAIDFMLIGICLGGGTDRVRKHIEPKDLLTSTGQTALKLIYEKNRELFAHLLKERFSVDSKNDEQMVDSLIRHIKCSNLEQSGLDLADVITESLVKCASLQEAEHTIYDALIVVREAIQTIKEMKGELCPE